MTLVSQILHFSGKSESLTWLIKCLTDCGNLEHFWHVEWFFAKCYSPSEHLAMDEVIMKFRKRVIFTQLYFWSINVLALKFASFVISQAIHMVWECAKEKTVMHTTMRNLIRSVEGVKTFYLFFLYTWWSVRKMNCCGIIQPNHKGVPCDFGHNLK